MKWWTILSWSTPDFWVLDFIRLTTAIACLVVGAMAGKLLFGLRERATLVERDLAKARVTAMILLSLVEFEQIGHRFLPWRLPLVMLCLFYCARVSWRRY
jgi:hypothetical protein